jgi:hypothetical protein
MEDGLLANCVLIAAPECRTDRLLDLLGSCPGVAALSGIPLSTMLFDSARTAVRAARAQQRATVGGSATTEHDEVVDGLSVGPAVLGVVLREVRSRVHCRHLVLHDCRGLVFPLVDATGLKLIELVRTRQAGPPNVRNAVRDVLNARRGPHRFPNLAGYLQLDETRVAEDGEGTRAEIMSFLEAGE